ncbi:hypothetical protein I8752_33335 [Nostocaceae cyanobacterium CENA369]|uniref:Uncharacterized protein n=1 Tax=Dendronalium phyllosphericum CENA369 TaxID=1725256 RepID=A0A8J7IBN5_9NOST|nr:hypothetical protein [Dendronalium phyllosphericum]MBH8577765.1 hypothetical protein [Dendronalium phyllosphericum CENA369]
MFLGIKNNKLIARWFGLKLNETQLTRLCFPLAAGIAWTWLLSPVSAATVTLYGAGSLRESLTRIGKIIYPF